MVTVWPGFLASNRRLASKRTSFLLSSIAQWLHHRSSVAWTADAAISAVHSVSSATRIDSRISVLLVEVRPAQAPGSIALPRRWCQIFVDGPDPTRRRQGRTQWSGSEIELHARRAGGLDERVAGRRARETRHVDGPAARQLLADNLHATGGERPQRVGRQRLRGGQLGDDRVEGRWQRLVGPPATILIPGPLERLGGLRRAGRHGQSRACLLAPEGLPVRVDEDGIEDHFHRGGRAQKGGDTIEV